MSGCYMFENIAVVKGACMRAGVQLLVLVSRQCVPSRTSVTTWCGCMRSPRKGFSMAIALSLCAILR